MTTSMSGSTHTLSPSPADPSMTTSMSGSTHIRYHHHLQTHRLHRLYLPHRPHKARHKARGSSAARLHRMSVKSMERSRAHVTQILHHLMRSMLHRSWPQQQAHGQQAYKVPKATLLDWHNRLAHLSIWSEGFSIICRWPSRVPDALLMLSHHRKQHNPEIGHADKISLRPIPDCTNSTPLCCRQYPRTQKAPVWDPV